VTPDLVIPLAHQRPLLLAVQRAPVGLIRAGLFTFARYESICLLSDPIDF
jgi:hypothetical protein